MIGIACLHIDLLSHLLFLVSPHRVSLLDTIAIRKHLVIRVRLKMRGFLLYTYIGLGPNTTAAA